MKRNTYIILAITITCSIAISSTVITASANELSIAAEMLLVDDPLIGLSIDWITEEYDTIWDSPYMMDCMIYYADFAERTNLHYGGYCTVAENYNHCMSSKVQETDNLPINNSADYYRHLTAIQQDCKAYLDIELAMLATVEP